MTIDWSKPFELAAEKYKNVKCSLLYKVNAMCYVILKFQNDYETVVTYHEDSGKFNDITLPRDRIFNILNLDSFDEIRMVNKGI